jgi:hypothetical protein
LFLKKGEEKGGRERERETERNVDKIQTVCLRGVSQKLSVGYLTS